MKAVFLDRDGVINKEPGESKYVTSPEDFRFLAGAKQAISALTKSGFKIFIISNQAGVGKGVFGMRELALITEKMLKGINAAGGEIEEVFYCTHRSEDNCACRKPKAGMITSAQKKFSIDLKKSFFVGDSIRDVACASAAGCRSILVLSGKERLANRKNWKEKPDFIFRDLLEASGFITKEK